MSLLKLKTSSPQMLRARFTPRAAAGLWLVFALVVLAVYYRQVWQIWEVGPRAWLSDTYSLLEPYQTVKQLVLGNAVLAFPAAPEAGRRAGAALLGAGLTLLAGLGLGAVVLRIARASGLGRADRWLFQTVLGLGALAYVSLAMAGLGVYTPDRLRLVVLFLAAGTLVGWGFQRLSPKGGRRTALQLVRFRSDISFGRDGIWMGIVLAACLVALVGALAPETEYDALWYHLWLPKVWLEHGTAVDLVHEYISLYPLTWELVYGAGMVLGGPVAAKLLHWICLPLGALLTFQITRRFFPGASGLFAAAVFASLPTVVWEATTAYNDLALAITCGLALYALLSYLRRPEQHWLVLAGLTLGLALATKHLAILVWLLAMAVLVLLRRRQTGSWQAALTAALPVAVISLLIPLPWYLRNWSASGNPFFPDLYGVFGAFPAERWSDLAEQGLSEFKSHFWTPTSPWSYLLLPWDVTLHSARFGGSLGPVLFLLLPGTALVGRKRRWFWLLGVFTAGYLALWASPLSSFQLRFLVPLAPVLAALAAAIFRRLKALLRRGSLFEQRDMAWKGIQLVFAGLLIFNLPPFISVHEGERILKSDRGWLTHVIHTVPVGVMFGMESQDSYLARKVPSYRAWQYINTSLPAEARVLTFGSGDHLYSERNRIWSDSAAMIPVVWRTQPGQEKQAVERLQQLLITHILVDRRLLAELEPGDLPLLEGEQTEEWLTVLYQDERFALYGIRSMQDGTFDGTY